MIEVSAAITLFLFGGGFALVCIFAGTILHMRFLDRKLIPPVPKEIKPGARASVDTKQIPAVANPASKNGGL